jgi:hypothetical protein
MKKKLRKIKRRKGGKSNLYFDINTHNAIIKFQNTEEQDEREKIYIKEIEPSFNKLVENLIFIHGFSKPFGSHESLKNDCITFLYETLGKFDHTRGSKAFSYFNVVAKNWLIIQSKKKIKNNRRHISIDDVLSLNQSDLLAIETHKTVPSQDSMMIKAEAIESLFLMMEKIKDRLNNENEISCMEAIITLFKNIDDLDLLNKRAIFVYMRDISNLNPKQLSVAMSVIRKHYKELLKTGDYDVFF